MKRKEIDVWAKIKDKREYIIKDADTQLVRFIE